MNYRGKDKLAEALKHGLLDKREKASEPVQTAVVNIAEAQALFEESVAKPTSKNIDLVSGALKPKRAPWAQKLYEENKPAPKPVAVPKPEKKKITLEFMKESVSGLKPEIDTGKKAIKSEVLAENISEINAAIAFNNSRKYKPAKTETLEEKVNRLEELLKKKLNEAYNLDDDDYDENGKRYAQTPEVRAKLEKDHADEVARLAEKSKAMRAEKKKKSWWQRAQTMGESVKQLDELSRGTLGSYAKKAMRSKDQSQKNIDTARDTINHYEKGSGSVYNSMDVAQTTAHHNYQIKKNQGVIKKRTKGLDNAVDRLTKESVEPLEELSAQTLTKYSDKAWLSKANAHIDRGGADYLDDDKARKTATKTIGKRERGMALAKNVMTKKDR